MQPHDTLHTICGTMGGHLFRLLILFYAELLDTWQLL